MRFIYGLLVVSCVCGLSATHAGEAAVESVAAIIERTPTKDFSTAASDKFIKDLTGLGANAIPKIIAALDKAAAEQSILTAPMITALIRLNAGQSVPLLLKLAKEHPLENIRSAALQGVAAFKNSTAIQPLMEMLAQTVRSRAAATPEVSRRVEEICRVLSTLNQTYNCCLSFCNSIVHDGDTASEELKLQWVYILQQGSYRAGEMCLLKLAKDPSLNVSAAAVQALGQAGSRMSESYLSAFLNSKERKVKVAAALAAGKLKANSTIPALVDLLSSTEQDVPDSALWALRSISGMQFPAEKQRWQHWYEGERAAQQEKLKKLSAELNSSDARRVALALEQAGTLSLLRDKLFETLVPFTTHPDYCVRAACCSVLGDCSDPRSFSLLTDKISDPSMEVSFAAWRALKSATGEQFPRDPKVWRDYVQKKGM